jgi:hypothetical protein
VRNVILNIKKFFRDHTRELYKCDRCGLAVERDDMVNVRAYGKNSLFGDKLLCDECFDKVWSK